MKRMGKVGDNLEVITEKGQKKFMCSKCGYVVCSVNDNYKEHVVENFSPITKFQPADLTPRTDRFVLKEYYCPKCAVMFEVETGLRDEERPFRSIVLRTGDCSEEK